MRLAFNNPSWFNEISKKGKSSLVMNSRQKPYFAVVAGQWLSHEASPLIQFCKYGVAGGLATLTHILVFFLLGWRLLPCLTADDIMVTILGVEPGITTETGRAINAAIANGLAFLVSNAVAYTLNIFFVFRSGRHKRLVEIGLFYAVSGVSVLIGTSLQSLLIARYGIMTTLAFGANVLSALMINYAMRKFFIFHG